MTRSRAALCALAALAGAFAIQFAWQPGLASLYDDSVSYLIMAQAFSPYAAASAPVIAAWPHEKYPPLFPLLIALGGGAHDWRIAHAWVGVAFAASVFLLGIHARNATRSTRIAWAAALVFAWMPGAWLNMKGILSEFPFMALTFATLVWHAKTRAEAPSRTNYVVLGALLAAVLLTRTIGVALLAAIAAAELARSVKGYEPARARQAPWALAIPVGAASLWYLARPAGGDDAYLAFGAGVAQGAVERGARWTLSLMAMNFAALLDAWFTALLIYWGEPWRPAFLAASFVGASGAAGAITRASRGEADGLYVLAFVAILVAWPFPGQMYRLALPVMPLMLVHALWAWQRILVRFAGETRALRWTPYASLLPLVLCVPAVLFYIVERAKLSGPSNDMGYRHGDIAEFYRIPERRGAEASAQQQIDIFEDLAQIRRTTPESARVMWYAPNYVALLAGRSGVALERGEPGAMTAQIRAAKPDYVYIASVHPRDSAGRGGNPLEAIAAAAPFADGVWRRLNARGELDAMLLKVDPARIASPP